MIHLKNPFAMKKILLILVMFALTEMLSAQNTVTVSGTVNNINTGAPVVNHPVMIVSDSANVVYFSLTVLTNPNGYYVAQIPLPTAVSTGVVTISTYDCQQYLYSYSHTYGPSVTAITQNFLICTSPQSCQANYTYSAAGPLTLQFLDLSVAPNTSGRLWNFGDGTSSNLFNPVHTFPAQGFYNVSLTVGAAGTTCYDVFTQVIYAGDSTASGCQAAFTYTMPAANGRLVYFFDQSVTAVPVTWTWDFGDGTTSNLQNPVHEFPLSPGSVTYNVCLTIASNNATCYDVTCMPVTIGGSQGCTAAFNVWPVSNSPLTMHFQDQSIGNIQSWTWEFGDGITQVITAPANPSVDHTFPAPGFYTACLMIAGTDSCSASFCMNFSVGDSLTGCQAYFSYMNLPGTTANTIAFTNLSVSPSPVSCLWNFGDGTTSTEQNPIHVFPVNPASVVYNVCLTITSTNGSCSDTYCKQVRILPNIPCLADFIALPSPNTLNTLYFDDISTGNIQTWTWSFGDGTTQTITTPASPDVYHTYQSPGFYNVCLLIEGADSCNSTKCLTVAVNDSILICQAQFSWFPISSNTNTTIQFNDLSTGNIAQWSWNFGDGTTSSLQNPVHSFTAPGIYYVCLSVSGPGCQSVWCANVEVGATSNCINYFTFSSIGLSVNFSGFISDSTAPQTTTFFWDFGDNQTDIGQNVIHTYTTAGIYYVTLTTTTVVNGLMCTYTSGQMITVNSNNWNQIYGQVFAGNFPLSQGIVLLFSLDTANYYVPFVDVAMIDSAGVYYFPMVPQGNFIIYAIPFIQGYMPTYYGNTLYWQSSAIVSLGIPNNPYNIQLIAANLGGIAAGTGTISGQISQGDFRSSLVDKITMLLSDQSGNLIKYCQVSSTGQFEFPALALGTYHLHAELAGCSSQDIEITITEENPSAEVNLTLSGHSILGVYDVQPPSFTGTISPNPAGNDLIIYLYSESNTRVNTQVYSLTSRLMIADARDINSGNSRIVVPVDKLIPGMYIVNIFTGNGLKITRKLIISR